MGADLRPPQVWPPAASCDDHVRGALGPGSRSGPSPSARLPRGRCASSPGWPAATRAALWTCPRAASLRLARAGPPWRSSPRRPGVPSAGGGAVDHDVRQQYGPALSLGESLTERDRAQWVHHRLARERVRPERRQVRIPEQIDHRFRSKSITDSDPNRSLIPTENRSPTPVGIDRLSSELSGAGQPASRATLRAFRGGGRWPTGGCPCARFETSCGCASPPR